MPRLPVPLVSTSWLADNFGASDLRLVDASWRMPGNGDAREEYARRHIPGAVFFPIDEIADRGTTLPHMLPGVEEFARAVGALGITETDSVVVYDEQGLFSAARVWWTFRAMGHEAVAVLDGGLPKWTAGGGPVTDRVENPSPARYSPAPRPADRADARTVLHALSDSGSLVLDARPAGRFAGTDPEPRPGLRRGHMPGAANLPSSTLVAADGTLKSPDELAALFAGAGLAPDKAVVTSCGSGVTAAILSLGLEALGHKRHALYDGSWAEWGDERNDPTAFPVRPET